MKVVLLQKQLTLSDSASIATYVRPPVVTLSIANEYGGDALSGHFLTPLQWSSKFLNGWKEEVPGHPTRSHQVGGPQNPTRLPDLIEWHSPDILYIHCAIFFTSTILKKFRPD